MARSRAPLLVALAALGVSANGLLGAPVLDDGWVIFHNPLVTRLDLGQILTEPYNAGGPATTGGVFRPLTTLTYALTYAAAGRVTWPYHLTNILLHALAALLVHALAGRLAAAVAPTRARPAALLAALLFAVHPVHVEAVAGLVGRAELLAAAGTLAALLLALDRHAAPWKLPAAVAAGTLGVLSKENAAVLPGLFALAAYAAPRAAGLDARPGPAAGAPRRALRDTALTAAVLLAPIAIYAALRPHEGAGVPAEAAWFGGRPRAVVVGTMSRALAEYARVLAWPHPLGLDFSYAERIPFVPWTDPAALGGAAVWGGLLALGLASLRRAPLRGLGILWAFVALAPVSNVLVPTGVLMAERLLYLPSVGACLWLGHGLAWAGEALAARRGPRAGLALQILAAALLAAWSTLTVLRNADWRRPRTLWEAELRLAPRHPVVNNNLAVELNAAGEHGRAAALLEAALASAPHYWRAHVNLGIARQRLGDAAGALAAFRQAARIAPREPEPQLFLGLLLLERGEAAGAAEVFGRAVALGPRDPRPRVALGDALARLGRAGEARAAYEAALALDPRDGGARAGLARLAAGGG